VGKLKTTTVLSIFIVLVIVIGGGLLMITMANLKNNYVIFEGKITDVKQKDGKVEVTYVNVTTKKLMLVVPYDSPIEQLTAFLGMYKEDNVKMLCRKMNTDYQLLHLKPVVS
jgi:hypothetical protein